MMRPWSARFVRLLVLAALAAFLAGTASAQVQITSQDGKSSFRFGVLLQPQAELLDTPDGDHTSQNLFLRRARLIFGGDFLENVSYFVETDSPNLGKVDQDVAGGASHKSDNPYIQDAMVTWSNGDVFKVDMGMILLPLFHNHQQGAGSLLAVDFSPFTFDTSAHTTSRVGRDYGAEARGYVLGQHLEYRAGVFQGVRGVDARNPFRTTARVVWYPFEAETGFFYTGTNFGQRKILAIGASYDAQRSYKTWAGDVYWDWPVGRDAVTVQADWVRSEPEPTFQPVDGNNLEKEDTWLLEAGWFFAGAKIEPFIQVSNRDFADPTLADESKYEVGVAWWARGHRFNLKLAGARLTTEGAGGEPAPPDRNQVVLQCQAYMF